MPILGILEASTLAILLGVLAYRDVRERRLPDWANLCLGAAGIGFGVLKGVDVAADRLIGALLGFLFFFAVRILYQMFRGREGLGLGDVKLAGAAGACVAWQGLPSWLLVSTLTAIGGTLLTQGGRLGVLRDYRIPFGLYLCLGCWVIWGLGPIVVG